ncbi:hypothetical protein Moror_13138 [Moniliophthora roreri MCA 2997]|uniref:Uncharacterized protein n=1 Tax=Moniliophthora roreri (strain MCA 2997) TaxID=1381753 RepID=V2YBE7_MONRO|nr:hypothetical protein Moror_13138 [Moniliophthora roreri MCA 2997]
MSKAPVTTQQPILNTSSMDLYHDFHNVNEKHQHQQTDFSHGRCESDAPCHRHCHQARLRRYLLPAIATLLAIAGLFAVSCFYDMSEVIGLGAGGLAKRATGDENSFVDRKYYLIVIFIGLVVVVILGIMLSFWCCKSSFENPLCFPCYLCACCGGLACLECIGCGLCAEGISEA